MWIRMNNILNFLKNEDLWQELIKETITYCPSWVINQDIFKPKWTCICVLCKQWQWFKLVYLVIMFWKQMTSTSIPRSLDKRDARWDLLYKSVTQLQGQLSPRTWKMQELSFFVWYLKPDFFLNILHFLRSALCWIGNRAPSRPHLSS